MRDDAPTIGIQLLEAPVERRADPRARRHIVDHLPPGTVIRRNLLVVNKTARTQRIDLYPAAASVDEGRFQFGEGRTQNDLASWISLDKDRLDLAPGDRARVRATVDVPPPTSAGERYAVIWASTKSRPNESDGINQIHRVGVRVYLDVGLGGEPPSNFTIGELVPARDPQGVPSVAIRVVNTGQRALDVGGSVSLSEGPADLRAGPFDVVQGTTLGLGETGTVTVRFPRELPNGPWKIDIALESGTVRQNATGEVTFPDPGEVGKPSRLFAPLATPWGILGTSLASGLVIAGVLFVVARRIRQRRRVGTEVDA
ncbi:hypothetical protein GCM10022225_20150 [Plantactinospora mayteni]|uniref:Peptidase n=1 Tax=Plantactinospora mayteni TaxID=566021 RepID=A0ABQ4ENH2_9ACTN|nr:hypothetical protein [Plantactinospora mayteni]GIG96196.1 hypothetical protein Pma05_27690 [Plantactinospora mayteni]